MVALIDKKINFLYFPFLGMYTRSTNTAIGYGSLRTTLEIDRLFVQQIYIRTANNTPISTGYVLQSDGQGGTFFGPAAIQTDYFALSSMISAGTALFTNTLSTSYQNNVFQIGSGFSTIRTEFLSTSANLVDTQNGIFQNIIDLSNLIVSISSYSSFVNTANLSYSTLSSYILNITNTFTPNTQTFSLFNEAMSSFASTQFFFDSNYSTLTGQTTNTFNIYSTSQQLLYVDNLSTISSRYRFLVTSEAANFSTLSTAIGNQQIRYDQSLSTGMSSYMREFSTIIGNEVSLLDSYQFTLTNTVSSLSTLFFSIATYSLSSQITLLNSTLSSAILNNVSSLARQLSTIEGTSIAALSGTLSTTGTVSNSLNSLSTVLQESYSTLAIELSITQTRGINSQLYAQFFQLGLTQSSILANNTSSIQYLSTIISSNFSTANYQFSTLINTNYSTLLGVGYSSILIANSQVQLSTQSLLASTLTSTNLFLVTSSNLQSTFLGNTICNSFRQNLSTITGSLNTINNESRDVQSTLYESLSSFSSSVYPFIFTMSNSLSSLTSSLTGNLSNYIITTVSNDINADLITISNNLDNPTEQNSNATVIGISNSLLGIISTTFSTLSSYSRTFAGLSSANVFTNNLTFLGPVNATQGVFAQFFQISNIISTYTYNYTGGIQTYRPNQFASQVLVQLWGAGGAAGTNTNGGGGAYVEGIASVDPTQIYNINVGGGGAFSTINYVPYNGGGKAIPSITGTGGGATNIFIGNNQNLNDGLCNIAIAAGGGGGGFISTFADWNAYDISTSGIVRFTISNSPNNTGTQSTVLFSNTFIGLSTFSTFTYRISSLYGTILSSPVLLFLSSFSSFTFFNFSTLSTATSINFSTSFTQNFSTFLNYSTFNTSTFSTFQAITSSIISTGFLNSTFREFVNSTIYLPCGSWGGAGGIATGLDGVSPISTFSNGFFSLGGTGGTQVSNQQPFISNIFTRSVNTPPIFSTIIRQSTFTSFVGDFVPQLMGYSPYLYPELSTNLITTSTNASNYTVVSTNVTQDATFNNYYSTVQNRTNSSTLAFYYTIRDLFSLQNTLSPAGIPAGTSAVDYTTDKKPTSIYSSDLSFTLNPLGSPYGIDIHVMPFPFDQSDPLLYSNARLYISSMLSTILYTSSATNTSGRRYFNKISSGCNYNGTYNTEGIFSNDLDRYTYSHLSTLTKYDNSILSPSTIETVTSGWVLSSFTDNLDYTINTSSIISSLYRQIFGGCNYINIPPTFAPYTYDSFLPIAAQSTLTSLVQQGGFVINYSTIGDFISEYFETSTSVRSLRRMYNVFVSSAGANGATLVNSLPITISSLTRDPVQSTLTSFNTNNLISYISNYFGAQDFTAQNFTINDISFTINSIADFPTVKLYMQTISTVIYTEFVSPAPQVFSNIIHYGRMGTILSGANALSTVSNTADIGLGGGGGGAGYYGGQAGAWTTPVTGANPYIQNKYFIGGGGGGGGSSYINPLTGTGNSLPGQTIYSGYRTHPVASVLGSGQGGIDSNSFNNYSLYSTFSSITTSSIIKNGGNGLIIITEYVDPFRIFISTATQTFVPLRIDATTNEVIVNKLVISSPQNIIMGPSNPSSFYLDFANYQQFFITLRDHSVSSFHLIPLSTVSSSLNFQTGNIYLNISTFSTNALLNFSSFNIENTWTGNSPGVLSSYGNRSTYLFEYSVFNSNVYLTTPRAW
jgi:Glycine rich protein